VIGSDEPDREELGRAPGAYGEVVLRRRTAADGDHLELVVDGVFAMDDVDTSTERALATEALARCGGARLSVLVGGLGLGWTAATAPLVGWARQGLLPALPVRDPRLRLHVADVAVHLAGAAGRYDAVLLDVDNGPAFLVHEVNAGLYAEPGLSTALAALRPGGMLAIWSSDPVPELVDRLAALPGTADVDQVVLAVERDGRRYEYALALARQVAQPS
jgi:spermidine synthase